MWALGLRVLAFVCVIREGGFATTERLEFLADCQVGRTAAVAALNFPKHSKASQAAWVTTDHTCI
jgi:hypothetical protein